MIKTANHILSKEGILTTFSIAKRISKKDLEQFRQKAKDSKCDSKKFQEMLKKTVFEETHKALIEKKIPGVIISGQNIPEEEKKMMMELTYFASVMARKINERKIDKFHSCYIINAIVSMLGLTENDFDEFHRKFTKYRDGDDSSSDTVGEI